MRLALAIALATALVASGGHAQEPPSLDALLQQIQQGAQEERAEDARREAEFRAAQDRQAALLAEAKAALAVEEARSAALEKDFAANEALLPDLEAALREKLGTLGELFGVVRQVAGDTLGFVAGSLVSAQVGDRTPMLTTLSASKALPSIDQLEELWFVLQQEMTESGKVVRFDATVTDIDGGQHERQVIRVGTFNVVAGGRYLQWVPETRQLTDLARQPPGRYLSTVRRFERATEGLADFALDPTRGTLLSLLIQTPDLGERIQQGGVIGYIIIVLGVIGFGVAVQRLIYLTRVGRRMRAEEHRQTPSTDSPLGRVLTVYTKNPSVDVETLELKLDEAIMAETPALERGTPLIKVISAAAPLLGLLGTVTGMIKTFQAITLFGTGDPKMMASGISEALVTTVLGLTVAIPLVLVHALVSGTGRGIVEVLEEQAAGLIARHAERLHGGAARG
jgi:biopolymer transport protein ExbB